MKHARSHVELAVLTTVGLGLFGLFGLSTRAAGAGSLERASEREIAQRPAESAPSKTTVRRSPAKALPNQPAKTGAAAKATPTLSPEVEQQVLAFVETHQSELGELLRYLKSKLPREYQRAVHDLDRTRQRLAQTERRDPQRYELELKLWQAQSQAQLLAAQIRTQPTERQTLSVALRETLKQAQEIKLQLLEREREKLLERAEKIEANMERIRENAERLMERELTALTSPDNSASPRRSQPAADAATNQTMQP